MSLIQQSGIYQIRNTVNGKVYIGSAHSFFKRRSAHFTSLRRGDHHSEPLQRSWKKHGESAFVFEPLLVCDKSQLLMYEQLLIDGMNPFYNICRIAGNCVGISPSAETRAKIGAAHKGLKRSEETRLRMSLAAKGKKKSPEHVAKMSQQRKGKPKGPKSEASKLAIIESKRKNFKVKTDSSTRVGRVCKFSEADIIEIRKMWELKLSYKSIAEKFGVAYQTIGSIIRRETYGYIP